MSYADVNAHILEEADIYHLNSITVTQTAAEVHSV